MRTIEATDEEIAALIQLIHRAVLHSGMDAAEAAVHWRRKLTEAVQAPPKGLNGQQNLQPPTQDLANDRPS